MRRILVATGALAVLAFAPAARAATQTLTFRVGPISIPGYFTVVHDQAIPSPQVDGAVTGFTTSLVDANGREIPYTEVMLHHIVFANASRPDATCSSYTAFAGERFPFAPDRFYARGEAPNALSLPDGYGLPNKGTDIWGVSYMLMNHRAATETVYVQYNVRYVTDQQLTPVRAYWLDVRNCRGDPVFDVPGTGGPHSTYSQAADFKLPVDGRIVAALPHVHGGGIKLNLSDATCGESLFTAWPTWQFRTILPVLHENGPSHISSFTTAAGIPVAAGHTLRLTGTYDDSLPHARVMAIELLYIAPGPAAGCAPVPPLQLDLGQPGPPPLVKQPLGRIPNGPVRVASTSTVSAYRFSNSRVIVRRGTQFRWLFRGFDLHNVTLANGPVGFSSPNLRRGSFVFKFTKPGTYRLYCSLHPVAMTQIVVVR